MSRDKLIMTASELIEKIQTREIKNRVHIRCHYNDGDFRDLWFMGNWFTKDNPNIENCPTFYKDIILLLCNPEVTYEIIDDDYENIKLVKATNEQLFEELKSRLEGNISEII